MYIYNTYIYIYIYIYLILETISRLTFSAKEKDS